MNIRDIATTHAHCLNTLYAYRFEIGKYFVTATYEITSIELGELIFCPLSFVILSVFNCNVQIEVNNGTL